MIGDPFESKRALRKTKPGDVHRVDEPRIGGDERWAELRDLEDRAFGDSHISETERLKRFNEAYEAGMDWEGDSE